MTPLGEWQPKTYETPALAYGFTQGYATSELLCALTFGIVVLNLSLIHIYTIMEGTEGTLYIEVCTDCKVVSMQHQQT